MSKVTLPTTTVSTPPRVNSGGIPHYASHRRLSNNPVQQRQRFWGFKSLRPAPPLNSAQILQLREVWLKYSLTVLFIAFCTQQEKEKDSKSSVKSHKAAFMNVATSFKRTYVCYHSVSNKCDGVSAIQVGLKWKKYILL